jgi:hypothetical protein
MRVLFSEPKAGKAPNLPLTTRLEARPMKRFLFVIILAFSLLLTSTPSQAIEDTGTEITGVIKNVSVNVHLVVINATESQKGEKDSLNPEPSIKSVSVQPHTKITVNGREATIKELQAGQPVKARLEGNSSKAISIEAGTVVAENH